MGWLDFAKEQGLFSGLVGVVLGALLSALFYSLGKRQARLTYRTSAFPLARRAESVTGDRLKVTWDGHQVSALYVVTAQVENHSHRDLEQLKVLVYGAPENIIVYDAASLTNSLQQVNVTVRPSMS